MLAARRTERVMGRIMFLTISIKTMKGIKVEGVPKGTRWAKKWSRLLDRLKMINLIHKGKARERVTARCLVAVKEKDNNPMVLLKIIKIKIEKNKIILIFLDFNSVENSLIIAEVIKLNNSLKGEDKIQ